MGEGARMFEAIALDPQGLRCLILTSAGDKAFCAGGDLKERDDMSTEAWTLQHALIERCLRALIECPLPIICAVEGIGYDGGCEIAGCCDFIYAARHARFALPEAKLGIMPGGAGTQTMPRAMGERRAKELLHTGKPFTAQEAAQWGHVNEIVDGAQLLERALESAPQSLRTPPYLRERSRERSHMDYACRFPMGWRLRSRPTIAWFRPKTV